MCSVRRIRNKHWVPAVLFAEQVSRSRTEIRGGTGASFDKSFAKSMVRDHQEDIKEYQKESSKTDSAGKLAKKTLPVLQKHLQTARSLEKRTAQSTR
jgi:predicted outer membrane protein